MTSKLIEEVTAHAQSDSLEDAREICADGTYFPNNIRKKKKNYSKPNLCCLLNVLPWKKYAPEL